MEISKTDQQWQDQLSEEEFYVCRQSGTESPFSGEYNTNKEDGIYNCTCCAKPLFESQTKFDSGTGWPSYYESVENSIKEIKDSAHGMLRVEVRCESCDSHLGHVFPDGPDPTGLRYCINSVSLKFEGKK